jgi:hypothetical protein
MGEKCQNVSALQINNLHRKSDSLLVELNGKSEYKTDAQLFAAAAAEKHYVKHP